MHDVYELALFVLQTLWSAKSKLPAISIDT